MGRVSAEEVRLYWYPSMDFVKSFSPVFHGRFQEVSGQVFLRGQFEYSSLGTGQNVLSFIFFIIVASSVLLPLLGRVTDRHTRRLEIAIPHFKLGHRQGLFNHFMTVGAAADYLQFASEGTGWRQFSGPRCCKGFMRKSDCFMEICRSCNLLS